MPTATMKFEPVSAQPGIFMPMSKDTTNFLNGVQHRFHEEDGRKFLKEFFHREPCLYNHKIYKQAAMVFDCLKLEVREYDPYLQRLQQSKAPNNNQEQIPNVDFDSDNEKRLAYEIVFSTLKYQRFLEDILEDCQFFLQYPEYRDDHGLVLIIFSDFKQRKFQVRSRVEDEECDPYLTDIEHALYRSMDGFLEPKHGIIITELPSHSVEHTSYLCIFFTSLPVPFSEIYQAIFYYKTYSLLFNHGPQILKQKQLVNVKNLFALRYNKFASIAWCKTKLNAALARRRIKAQVLSIDDLLPKSVRQNDKVVPSMQVYCWVNQLKTNVNRVLDNLHDEGFSAVYTHRELTGPTYLRDCQCNDAIVLPSELREWAQDHPLVTGGHLVIQDKSSCLGPKCIQQILNEGDDVVQVNIGSGLSSAHLASLTHHMDTTILAFGVQTEKQHNQVTHNLERLGASSRVKLIPDKLEDMDLNDDRLKNIKVALLSAECSRSGVTDPVNFLVTEGEDLNILKTLSQGDTHNTKLGNLVTKHNKQLTSLLKLSHMQAVIYCTRSIQEAENESIVIRAIEYANMVQKKNTNFRVSPPVLPLSQLDIEGDSILSGKYLRYQPSAHLSGCFIATVTREAVDPKEAAKEVLARAAAKGLISGVPPEALKKTPKVVNSQPNAPKKGRKKVGPPKRSKSQPNKGGVRGAPVGAGMVQTMSVPAAHTTIQPFSCNTAVPRNHLVQQTTFTPLVPFGLTVQTQPASRKPQSPPEHRKVVQHPKPFR